MRGGVIGVARETVGGAGSKSCNRSALACNLSALACNLSALACNLSALDLLVYQALNSCVCACVRVRVCVCVRVCQGTTTTVWTGASPRSSARATLTTLMTSQTRAPASSWFPPARLVHSCVCVCVCVCVCACMERERKRKR